MPTPTPEYRFHPVRKFRWDWAWPEHRLALEVEGGVWSGGAHGRGTGIVRDMAKSTLAAEEGWRIIRVTPSNLATEATMDSIHRALQWRTTEA
jgi:very-short-patch-repair endonuclease